VIEVLCLEAGYGRAAVLFGIAIEARRGEVVALLGRNGAGKSTILKAIMGLAPPRAGEVRFEGSRIDRLAPHRIARLGLGYVPEDRRIFTDLTVAENLEVGRRPAREGIAPWTPARLYELFPSLGRMPDRLGARMSGGEQQMLALARTLMGNPRALLLDEPSEGLAPVLAGVLARTIRELKGQGLTVLLCEQNLHFAQQVADRAYLIEQGQIRRSGTLQEIREEYQRL